jgi:S-formylglutathione hydrolase FrmB
VGGTVTVDFYGRGKHTWPYWEQELHRSFGFLKHAIGAD